VVASFGVSLTIKGHNRTFYEGRSCFAKLFPDEQYDKEPRHDTDFRATFQAGVHRIYLPAPLDAVSAKATRLSWICAVDDYVPDRQKA
jgi:hypothetical protein